MVSVEMPKETFCFLHVKSNFKDLIMSASSVSNKHKWRIGFSFHNRIPVKTKFLRMHQWLLRLIRAFWPNFCCYFAFTFSFSLDTYFEKWVHLLLWVVQRSSRLLGKRQMSSGCGFFDASPAHTITRTPYFP